VVTAAGAQDRDGARPLLNLLANRCYRVRMVRAGGAYPDRLLEWARRSWLMSLTNVKRGDDVTGFVVLPRRCWWRGSWRGSTDTVVVYATTSDYPRAHHEVMVRRSMIRITSRRPTRQRPASMDSGAGSEIVDH
jgi:hypothetical protein